jgi:1-acyl-sn-glycerol-3-phosphate acyltransferase
LARLLWGFRVDGRENVPAEGPLVVACNHVSVLDPPLLAAALPRETGFVAKQELFAVPGLGGLIRSLNAMPIDRSRLSRATLDRLGAFLDQGRALLVFPEGTRSRNGRLGSAKPGVGMLLLQHPAMVQPAYIVGTDAPWRNLFRRGRMRVVFGRPHPLPWEPPAPSDVRVDARDVAESVLDAIRRLRDGEETREAGFPAHEGPRAMSPDLRADDTRIRDEGTETRE